MADWSELADFLATPQAHGGVVPTIVDTHSARVALSPAQAWKMRRPVDYGWMDYGTVARRLAMSEREIDLNRRTAPDLYVGIGWIVRDRTGHLQARPPGRIETGDERLEPAVVMHRFRDADLLDAIARRGELDPDLAARTGRAAARLHLSAEILDSPVRLARFVETEAAELVRQPVFDAARTAAFGRKLKSRAAGLAGVARARQADGAVRFCHGDLHLRNIVLWHGEPVPFDSIEFNDDFAVIDVLYDLAFLLMDLVHRDLAAAASAAFNGWAEAMGACGAAAERVAFAGLALLPLYLSVRAAIRAKVSALAVDADPKMAGEARAYLDLGINLLTPSAAPRLLAIGGRSGTGKSVLARALAPRVGHAPGALVLRSDAIRKGLAGVAPDQRLPAESYTPQASADVYTAMLRRARMALLGGHSVILDAAHLRAAERGAAADLARDCGVAFTGVWLEAPLPVRIARIAGRTGDVSDATPAVAERQESLGTDPHDWLRLDALAEIEDKTARVLAHPA